METVNECHWAVVRNNHQSGPWKHNRPGGRGKKPQLKESSHIGVVPVVGIPSIVFNLYISCSQSVRGSDWLESTSAIRRGIEEFDVLATCVAW